MKEFLKKLQLAFDNKDDTGFDYKKLTAFWFVVIATHLIVAYSIEKTSIWWIGIDITFRKDLFEFKYILGMILVFILVLSYFTDSKSLSQFLYRMKDKDFKEKEEGKP